MEPLVSILISCYNYEKFVAEAIQSALNQTYQNIEVVVVDDGSTDSSLQIIKSFGNLIKYDSIQNSGACIARNRALEISNGEYIQFLDADDLLEPEKIKKHLPYLLDGRADIVFGGAYYFGEFENVTDDSNYPEVGEDPFIYLLNWPLGTAYPLHKRERLVSIGGFKRHLSRAQEYDLHLRLTARGAKIIKLKDKLLGVRMHNQPRITKCKQQTGDFLKLLIDISKEMESEQLLTDVRITELSKKISKISSYTFRNGNKLAARNGFMYAKSLSGNYYYQERIWVTYIAALIGPYLTEQFLDFLRIVFRKK